MMLQLTHILPSFSMELTKGRIYLHPVKSVSWNVHHDVALILKTYMDNNLFTLITNDYAKGCQFQL